MIFAHDTETSLVVAVNLVNSSLAPDALSTQADLMKFLTRHHLRVDQPVSAADLDAVRALRPELESLLLADRGDIAERLNALFARTDVLPRLVRHDGHDFLHIHYAAPTAPLATRIVTETAMALADAVNANETSRLSRCADDHCSRIALDLSRNRCSKRYCSLACGNRNAVAAMRHRRGAR